MIDRYRQFSFKELAHAFIQTGESRICRVGQQAGPRGDYQSELEGTLLSELPLPLGGQCFSIEAFDELDKAHLGG